MIALTFLVLGILVIVLVCVVGADRIYVFSTNKCPECSVCPPPIICPSPSPTYVPANHPKFAYTDPDIAKYQTSDRVLDVTDQVVHADAVPNPHIQSIIYINMARSTERNRQMQDEIRRWNLGARVFRFDAITHENRSLGCFQSHVHCVGWASLRKENVLILEDDFVLDVNRQELDEYLQMANECVSHRWDVIQLAQYVHKWQRLGNQHRVFRLLHSTTASGYLVNRHYATDFLKKWSYDLEARMHLDKFEIDDWNDQTQLAYQKEDTWLGFDQSLGSQRAGTSTIGQVYAHNKWRCNLALTKWYSAIDEEHPLLTLEAERRMNICFVMQPAQLERIPEMWRSAFKHHTVSFHVEHSNSENNDPDMPFVSHHDGAVSREVLCEYEKVFYVDNSTPIEYGLLRGGDFY